MAATREALVNAAKHAQVETVQVYAEVGGRAGGGLRARPGSGFDAAAVPDDRYGLAQSVVGRMERHGGRAVVRSAPGAGTEVRLEVPR